MSNLNEPIHETDETEIHELKAELREEFQTTILFRQRTGAKYQTDTRNQRALQMLTKLLNTVDNIPDHVMLAYGKALDAQPDDSAIDAALRAIGFKVSFDSAIDWVQS